MTRTLPAQTILRAAQGWQPHCAGCVSAYIQSRVSLQACQLKHAAEHRHKAEQQMTRTSPAQKVLFFFCSGLAANPCRLKVRLYALTCNLASV